jgi:hypothetical protein
VRPHLWILGAVVALVLGAILVLLLGSAGPRYASKTTETATRDVYEGSAKVGELSVVVEQENNGVIWTIIWVPFVKTQRLLTMINVLGSTAVLTITNDAYRMEPEPISPRPTLAPNPHPARRDDEADKVLRRPRRCRS